MIIMENVLLPKPLSDYAYEKLIKLGIKVNMNKKRMGFIVPAQIPKNFKITIKEFKDKDEHWIEGTGNETIYYVLTHNKKFLACGIYWACWDGSGTIYIFDENEYLTRFNNSIKVYKHSGIYNVR